MNPSIKSLLEQHGLQAKYSFGQNFLKEPWAHQSIMRALGINEQDTVIELGAGLGHLTQWLVTSQAARILAYERDRDLIPILKERFKDYPQLSILEANIKTIDYKELIALYPLGLKIIGNIPYQLTSTIFFTLLEHYTLPIHQVALLIQKEVAERINAPVGTKEYGLLTVLLNALAKVNYVATVNRHCFYPAPRVDSAIISFSFIRDSQNQVNSLTHFISLVKRCFQMRRKTLGHILSDMAYAKDCLNTLNIDQKRRPETLSPVDFIHLSNQIGLMTSSHR